MPKHEIFKAEQSFTCPLCNKEHAKGTRALLDKNTLVAADCFFAKIKKAQAHSNTNPQKAVQRGGSKPSTNSAGHLVAEPSLTFDAQAWIEANLDDAIALAKKKVWDPSLPVDLTPLIVEFMHEAYGFLSEQRIQRNKLRNIGALK